MNLADHFLQSEYAFCTFSELGAWCSKQGFNNPAEKRELLKALQQIGGKIAAIQWHGKPEEKAVLYVSLLDNSLWNDRECWGKGVQIIDLK
jgi:hypothetical protein